jgi:hypothetical protein
VSERARELAQKRAALQARCAVQREELAELSYFLEMRLSRVDRAVYLVRRALSAPILIGVAVTIGLLFGPRRLIRLASRGAFLVSMARRFAHR